MIAGYRGKRGGGANDGGDLLEMAALDDLDEVLERWQLAAGELVKGNPEPVQKLWSHREDVSLANPYGPPVRGWEQVAKTGEQAAAQFRDGEMVAFEIVEKHVTAELAYVVQIERAKAKIAGGEEITPFDPRVTMIFRPEEGTWKVVHRHADPITTPRPAESVIQQ
jgi:ketosteroid isomerase-like protein